MRPIHPFFNFALGVLVGAVVVVVAWTFLVEPSGVFTVLGNGPMGPGDIYFATSAFLASHGWPVLIVGLVIIAVALVLLRTNKAGIRRTMLAALIAAELDIAFPGSEESHANPSTLQRLSRLRITDSGASAPFARRSR